MEKVNCSKCNNVTVDLFTGVYSCKLLNCGCHLEESNFFVPAGKPNPRLLPDMGEDKCPGMDKFVLKTAE